MTSSQEIDESTYTLIAKINNGDSSALNKLLNQHNFEVNGYLPKKEGNNEKVTLLYCAAKNNHVEVVQALLKQPGIDINKATIPDELPPIYAAMKEGHMEVFKLVLQQPDTDVNAYFPCKNDKHVTLLYRAAQYNKVEIVRELLKQKTIDVNKPNGLDKTPLYSAAREGHPEIIKLLLAHPEIDINKKSSDNTCSPFYLAVQNGYLEAAKMFLENPDLDVNNARSSGSTPIYVTVKFGHLQIVNLMLERPGVLVNQPLKRHAGGETPLYVACKQGLVDVVKTLLKYPGIDINKKLYKSTKSVQENDHPENDNQNVEFFEHSADDSEGVSIYMNTYQHYLQHKGQGQTTLARICGYAQHIEKTKGWKFFAEGQGSRNLEDSDDGEDDNLVKLLQIHEVQIVLRSVRSNRCVIVRPTISSMCETIKILLGDEKIDLGVKDDEGKTALFQACKYGHAQFITILLDNSASINQVCEKRSWLEDFFRECGTVTQFFTEHGTVLIDALSSDIERLEKLKVLFSRLDLLPNQISQYYLKFGKDQICVSGNIVIGAILMGFENDDGGYLKSVMEAASNSTHIFNIDITWLHKSEFGNFDLFDISTLKHDSILDFLIVHNKISLVAGLFQAFLKGQIKISQMVYYIEVFPGMAEKKIFHPILNNFVEHEHLVVQRVGELSTYSKKEQQKLWGLLGGAPYLEKLVDKATDFNIFRSIFVNSAVENQWTRQTQLYYYSQFGVFLLYLILFLAAVLVHLDWSLKVATEKYVGVGPILWCTLPFIVLMIISEILQFEYSLPDLKNCSFIEFIGGLLYDVFQIQTLANLLDWFIIIVGFILPFVWSRDDENLMSVVAILVMVLFFRLYIWLMLVRKEIGHYMIILRLITWRTSMFIVVIVDTLFFFTVTFMVMFQKTEHSMGFFQSLLNYSQALFGNIDFDSFYDLNSPAREIGLALHLLFLLFVPIILINLLIALMTSIFQEVSEQREAIFIRSRALIALEANQVFENIRRILPWFQCEQKEVNVVRFEQLRKELGFVVGGSLGNQQDFLTENFSRMDKQYLEVQKQLLEIQKMQAVIVQKIM